MSQKRVLVTGAAGFIGFHLSRALVARGDFVIGYDNYNTYYAPWLKEKRTALLGECGVEVVVGDLKDAEALQKVVTDNSITHIVNLAAQAGVRYSLENPHAYIESNVTGFLNVLEVCRNNPEIVLVYASSSSVYGLNEKIPFSTDDRCDHQASLYGATKKSNELMAHTYNHLFGVRATGLRFFTVYGPWGRPDMAPMLFAGAILAGKPINVFNHGKMLRDFTYIDDIVAGTVGALDLGADCEVFNLGNNTPVELGHFIKTIENSLGMKAEKNMMPMQAGDVLKTYADIDRSQELLGYEPKTQLEEGIPRFIEWYKEHAAPQNVAG